MGAVATSCRIPPQSRSRTDTPAMGKLQTASSICSAPEGGGGGSGDNEQGACQNTQLRTPTANGSEHGVLAVPLASSTEFPITPLSCPDLSQSFQTGVTALPSAGALRRRDHGTLRVSRLMVPRKEVPMSRHWKGSLIFVLTILAAFIAATMTAHFGMSVAIIMAGTVVFAVYMMGESDFGRHAYER